MITKILQIALLASVVHASKKKHNGQGGFLPDFNFFGFTNLDVLDFYTGAGERAFGKDVRREWRSCFKHLSFNDEWTRFQ